ncbi:LysR substrate-binding domain-containing protein [Chitinibacteraceae bacterium HSL-7]
METIDLGDHAQTLTRAMAFAAVVEQGSFTRAAEHLQVSKALLSRQVRELEARLGSQLLFRTTRRLHLTEAGALYLEHCRDWMSRLDAAQRAVEQLRGEVSGTLRITVPGSFGSAVMVDALLAFRARYPLVELELDLSSSPRDLEAEHFDLAIRANLDAPANLICRPLAELSDWLVARPDWLAAQTSINAPADLLAVDCLYNANIGDSANWTLSRGTQRERIRVRAPLRCNDYYLIRNFALAGAGVARLPPYLAAPDVDSGRLVRVLPEYRLSGMTLSLLYPQRLPQPAKVDALVRFLLDWFAAPERSGWQG